MPLNPYISEAVEETLAFCRASIYQEPFSTLHQDITKGVWEWLKARVKVSPGDRVLDVGAGFGAAMRLMRSDGVAASAITLEEREHAALLEEFGPGSVGLVDMHEIGIFKKAFNGIFARHVLEHSPMPFVWLRAARGALVENGWLYLEMPAPDTASNHDYENANHFSVLGRRMWQSLIERAGFTMIDTARIEFENVRGPDQYFSFLARAGG